MKIKSNLVWLGLGWDWNLGMDGGVGGGKLKFWGG